jgi:hypothetical protein
MVRLDGRTCRREDYRRGLVDRKIRGGGLVERKIRRRAGLVDKKIRAESRFQGRTSRKEDGGDC